MASFASVTRCYADSIIDAPPADFRVSTQIYRDPIVFDDEMRNIFERTWVYVAHVSELPSPGDYKVSAVGRLPVIVSRDKDGAIHVLLNVCRHRGAVLCRTERGNTNKFVCPYHAWIYGSDGKLLSTSSPEGGFPEGFAESVGGLTRLPRVATYRGLIFTSVSAAGETLEDYLGAVRYYVDLWFDQSPSGNVRLLPPRRCHYQANWKLQLENTTDGWHPRFVHESAFRTMADFEVRPPNNDWRGYTRAFRRGHNILDLPLRANFAADILEEYKSLLVQRYGAAHAELAHNTRHITLFPNVHLLEFKIRVVQPVAVDKTIVYEFPIEFEDAPERINSTLRRRINNEGSLAAGFVNSDDVDIFTRVQSGLHAAHLTNWLVLARDMGEEQSQPSGELIGEDFSELPQRAIYREWRRLMTADVEHQRSPAPP